MKRQRVTLRLRLQLRTGPKHTGGLVSALAAALESRLIAAPARFLRQRLGMTELTLRVADDAPDDAVTDRLALERGRYRGNKRIPIRWIKGGGGAGYGEKLRLTERDWHGNSPRLGYAGCCFKPPIAASGCLSPGPHLSHQPAFNGKQSMPLANVREAPGLERDSKFNILNLNNWSVD